MAAAGPLDINLHSHKLIISLAPSKQQRVPITSRSIRDGHAGERRYSMERKIESETEEEKAIDFEIEI
ncbi:hypothetical protein DAPPUDRAFT_249154 [Daphnia pulex]|uniref:Uncharacterized protein n=1 Tax=Daphnia pulex TaxID=6669 RepID=E9GVZ8_DAPPU|nr:hypothetical protein DAPPUDRAFT_249154 [Daphnia pulex]|eukprot:EFX76263.1 hypothetical protein DAPPUDRAFT_249154 [Daphnia pulex]